MAKFLNKKEQVYDLKLTTYGHYLYSLGSFEPIYYAFFDDNIIYDKDYARVGWDPTLALSGTYEPQNDIIPRIRETQYLETLTLFEDLESLNNKAAPLVKHDGLNYFDIDLGLTVPMVEARKDNYRFSAMIGDAYLEGNTQNAAAWKVVALNGLIMSSSLADRKGDLGAASAGRSDLIPQININLNYSMQILREDAMASIKNEDFRVGVLMTDSFADGNILALAPQDLLIFAEELNTALLTENFDIEVFEVETDANLATCQEYCAKTDILKRKYFPQIDTKINGGLMKLDSSNQAVTLDSHDDPNQLIMRSLTNNDVEYYFSIRTDNQIKESIACKAASEFNRDSYYIDIDFECQTGTSTENIIGDIYGKVTEAEICL